MPWTDLALDFKEGLPHDESLLVVVCYTSRFVQVEPMKNPTSAKVILALLNKFSKFGVPNSITADGGPQFRSHAFAAFCKSYSIHLNLSTPYWPERNGAVERQNRNLSKRIRISVEQKTDWKADIYEYLMLYHSTPQEMTGMTPAKMMLNREISNLLPTVNEPTGIFIEGAKERDHLAKEKRKDYANEKRNARENDISVGETVLMKNLHKRALQPNFSPEEFQVKDVNGSEVTVQSSKSDAMYVRNRAHLKRLDKRATSSEEGKRGNVDEVEQPETLPKRQRRLPERLQYFEM